MRSKVKRMSWKDFFKRKKVQSSVAESSDNEPKSENKDTLPQQVVSKDSSYSADNNVDPDIIKAVAESDEIPEKDKPHIAYALQNEVNEKGISNSDKASFIAAGVALVAGASAFYPKEAYAFCGGVQAEFEQAIIDGLTEPFADAVNDIFDGFLDVFDQITGAASSLLSSTVTSSADALNAVSKAIADNQAKAAAAPPPDACGSDTNKGTVLQAKSSKGPEQVRFDILAQEAILSTDADVWPNYFKELSENPIDVKMSMNYGFATKQKTSTDPEPETSKKYTDNFFLLTIGETESNRRSAEFSGNIGRGDDKTNFGYDQQQKIAFASARAQVATHGLSLGRSARGSESEPGVLDAFESEIRRTYSNETWRSQVRNYADPTPGAIELILQTSFQNAVLLETLEAMKTNNVVLGTTLMEMIDTGDDR